MKDALEIVPGVVQKSEVVERTSAAQMTARDRDAEAGARQHVQRRAAGLRIEVVVERVHPENDVGIALGGCAALASVPDRQRAASKCPLAEAGRRAARHFAVAREAQRSP